MIVQVRPVTLPPVGRVRALTRLRLVAEVLSAYPRLLRVLKGNDIEAMVRTARHVEPPRSAVPPQDARETSVRLGIIVREVLARLPTDHRCLITSLVLVRVLERRGIPATVVIGVATTDGFGAHAWVEHDSMPLLAVGHHERLLEL